MTPGFDQGLRTSGQYHRELEQLCGAIRGQNLVRLTGADGLRPAELLSAACLSAWRREKMRLPHREEPELVPPECVPPLFIPMVADTKARRHG